MSNQVGYERQNGGSTDKSWPLKIFLLGINLFLIFKIIDIRVVVNISLWIIAFAVALILFNYLRRRFSSEYVVEDDVRDLVPLTLKYLRINKKYLLASILGLTLAVMVISQILLLSNAGGGNIYATAFADGHLPLLEYEMDNYDSSQTMDFKEIKDDLVSKFNEFTSEEDIEATDLYTFNSYNLRISVEGLDETIDNDYRQQFQTDIADKHTYELLKRFPTFPDTLPYSDNLSILILQQNYYDEEEISDYINDPSDVEFIINEQNFSIPIDYIWKITEEDRRFSYERDLENIIWKLRNKIFVPHGSEDDLFSQYNPDRPRSKFRAHINPDSLKGRSTSDVIQSIHSIKNKMYSYLSSIGINAYENSESTWKIRNLQAEEAGLKTILLLVAMPMIGISMYLVYFSLNLVELRKQNLVSIMKVRGISSGQLRFMMIVESMVAAVIAIILGMLASIPWTQYILDKTDLYGPETTVYLAPEWFWTLPLVGFILAIDLNVGSILSISSTTVEEGEESEEKKEPFWRRFYLDVIFTVVGLTHWLVIRFIPFEPYLYRIILFTGIYSLPLLVLGLPLFVSRYYANFLSFISDFLWKREGNLFALATRNMRRNKFSASKLAVLLMIGMMFSFVAIGVPHSFTTWTNESAGYQTGADFRVDGIDPTNSTHIEAITNQSQISSYSEVKLAIFHEGGIQYGELRVLGVNPSTFEASAFWNSEYADKSLSKLMDQLKNGKILLQEDAKRVTELEFGENLVIELQTTTINEEVGGSFKYWPRLLQYLYYSEHSVGQMAIVMPLDMYNSYFSQDTSSSAEFTTSIYAKASDGANHSQIFEGLNEEFTGISSVTITGKYDSTRGLVESTEIGLLFAMFDTLLVITILTSIIGVGYFSFVTLAERKREIGVFRAVGMVSKQIFTLLVVESVILVSSSILIGVLSGSFIASNLFLLLGNTYGGDIPPIDLIYPPVLTIGFVIVSMIASIIAAAIPARSTANKQTGSILRAE